LRRWGHISKEIEVGFLWDLFQQTQIERHIDRADSVEERVASLEGEVQRLSGLVRELIGRLETKFEADMDGDGRVG
jgi:hypothetical protein